MLGLLLRQRARLVWNRVWRAPRRGWRLGGVLLVAGAGIGFAVLAGVNTSQLIQRVALSDRLAATAALPMLLVGVTGLTFVTSLSSAFHHLFMAGDQELLLAAPIPARSLFWLKIVEIWRDSVHVLLFQAAALFGFGQILHLPMWYYPLALLVGLALTLGASAAGATVTLVLARVRFGDSVLGLSRLVAILLFLPIGVLGVPALGFGRNRFQPLLNLGNVDVLGTTLRDAGPPPAWAPTTWAAHLLLGDEAAGLSLALLAVTGVVVVVATQIVFDGLFRGGWERVRYAAPRRQRPLVLIARLLPNGLPGGPIVGLLQKDWRTLLRDPRWRTGALVSLIALGVPALVLFAGDPFARTPHGIHFWLSMLPVPYLAYLFGSQHGGATLAYEGRNLTLLRAAPVGMVRVLTAKVLGGLVVVMTVTWAATLAMALSHGGEPFEVGAALLAATWLAVGVTLAAVAGAALTADFEGDNPQRRVGCVGTIVTSALSLFFFVSNTAVLVWWVLRSLLTLPRPVLTWVPLIDWGLPLLALISISTIVLASRVGVRRLAAWETS